MNNRFAYSLEQRGRLHDIAILEDTVARVAAIKALAREVDLPMENVRTAVNKRRQTLGVASRMPQRTNRKQSLGVVSAKKKALPRPKVADSSFVKPPSLQQLMAGR